MIFKEDLQELEEEIKELKKENRQLLHKVRRRIERIENLAEVEGLPSSPASVKFREVEQDIPSAFANPLLEGLSDDQKFSILKKQVSDLKALRRDVKYVDMLKSASVKGYKSYLESWQMVEDVLVDDTGEGGSTKLGLTKKDFFDIYDKLVEQRQLAQNYKYDVFNAIVNEMVLSKDERKDNDFIVSKLVDLIDTGTKEYMTIDESLAFAGSIEGLAVAHEVNTEEWGKLYAIRIQNGNKFLFDAKRNIRRNTSIYRERKNKQGK